MTNKNQKKIVTGIPEGFHTVTPFLQAQNANELLDFIVKAFNGKVTFNMKHDDGKVMHATVKIGNSLIMVSETMDNMPPVTAMLYLYVEDVDAQYQQALSAQAISVREPKDEFYGDRSAGLKDKWNNQWWIATHTEDVSPDEMEKRKEEMMSGSVK
jgi:uncharacterized glyoxalase superfamily protein PhnB